MNKYKLAVFMTRAQPIHNGHLAVIEKARSIADKVLILVGSANTSRSPRNPFSYEEREHMIKLVDNTLAVEPLDDFIYEENQWLTEVQDIVSSYAQDKVCLIGHTKDKTSYYLNKFPQWDLIDVEYHEVIDATQIRELLFQRKLRFIDGTVPLQVMNYLIKYSATNDYMNMRDEYEDEVAKKKTWAGSPYAPSFHTTDAVVIQSGHILLVKRKFAPGKGLWALPGGFIEEDEEVIDAVIRELREETRLKVCEKVLLGSIKVEKLFSAPKRSARGRTYTSAYLFQLDDSQPLPKVKGSDDALQAKFIPLSDFYMMATEIFEDHYHIVRKLLDNK